MADENESTIADATGPIEPGSPVKSPADVPVSSRWYVVYSENFAHCYSCRGRLRAEFLAFIAGLQTFLDRDPQRVVTVEFDTEPECDAETTARAFHRYGYFSDDRPWGC